MKCWNYLNEKWMRFQKVIRGPKSTAKLLIRRARDPLHGFHPATHGPFINSACFLCGVSVNNGQCGLACSIKLRPQSLANFRLSVLLHPHSSLHNSQCWNGLLQKLPSANTYRPWLSPHPGPITFSSPLVPSICLRDWSDTHPYGKRAEVTYN